MDRFVSIVVSLFVLSLLSERVVDFLKMWIPFINRKRSQEPDEARRVRRIHGVSWLVGTVVASLCNANLVVMLRSESSAGLFASPRDEVMWGFLLTGFLLSWGSKFWHDVLDLLLFAKNARRALQEEATYRKAPSEILKSLQHTGGSQYRELITHAMQERGSHLQSYENVNGLEEGTKFVDGKEIPAIVVHVEKKIRDEEGAKELEDRGQLLPTSVEATTPDNKTVKIPVDVIEVGETWAMATSIYPSHHSIANKEPINDAQGVFGCCVKGIDTEEPYILTCYHVVKHATHSWSEFESTGNEEVIDKDKDAELAVIKKAVLDEHIDASLASPVDGVKIRKHIVSLGSPTGTRVVTADDVTNRAAIKFKGRRPGVSRGIISNYGSVAKDITYHDGNRHTLRRLIKITTTDDLPVAIPGDSGALLMDEYNRALGLIVASDDRASYAIPIASILNGFGITLC